LLISAIRLAEPGTARGFVVIPLASPSSPLSAFAADRRHVLAVAAHGDSTLTARFASLVGREPVRRSFRVRCFAAFAGNFALFCFIH
jgi:hypothetical protein